LGAFSTINSIALLLTVNGELRRQDIALLRKKNEEVQTEIAELDKANQRISTEIQRLQDKGMIKDAKIESIKGKMDEEVEVMKHSITIMKKRLEDIEEIQGKLKETKLPSPIPQHPSLPCYAGMEESR
jgi:seryl-tRNA synthetase